MLAMAGAWRLAGDEVRTPYPRTATIDQSDGTHAAGHMHQARHTEFRCADPPAPAS